MLLQQQFDSLRMIGVHNVTPLMFPTKVHWTNIWNL